MCRKKKNRCSCFFDALNPVCNDLHRDAGEQIICLIGAMDESSNTVKEKCEIYLLRHGDRHDFANPEWKKKIDACKGLRSDPPLSKLGHEQARETAKKIFHNVDVDEILVSPYLRHNTDSSTFIRGKAGTNFDRNWLSRSLALPQPVANRSRKIQILSSYKFLVQQFA